MTFFLYNYPGSSPIPLGRGVLNLNADFELYIYKLEFTNNINGFVMLCYEILKTNFVFTMGTPKATPKDDTGILKCVSPNWHSFS